MSVENSYLYLCDVMKKNGCDIITTLEEYNLKRQFSKNTCVKVNYKASCGHVHDVFSNSFIGRLSGVKCPSCKSKENANKKKGKMNTEDGQCIFMKQEDDAIEYITNIIHNDFIVKKMTEGCLADFAIKPKNINEDKWLMIQMKTTEKPLRDYGFNCSGKYHDCAILCVCLSDKRMWLLNGNEITVSKKIGIGLKKSKYSINEITRETIVKKLTEYYDTLPLSSYDVINVPISICQQKEQEYRMFYQNKCDFLPFEYNEKSNMVYDFKINNFKVQEKIGSYHRGRNGLIIFTLHKNNGTIDGIRKLQAYKVGDNDFYWLNFPDKRYFYVLPEHELIKHHHLANGLQKGKKNLCVNIKNGVVSKFDSKFLFDLENLDKDRLKNLFVN
jgi:hypothetical protein